MEAGEQVYPFNISLPHQLPSTFNGEHGHIRYIAKVTIDIPWAKDKETEKTFQVISPLNLNDEPSLAASIIFILSRQHFFSELLIALLLFPV